MEIAKSFGVVVLILLIVSCATQVANTVAHLEPVPEKSEVLSSFSEEQLAQGELLFEQNCAECHKLKDPASRDPEQWNNVLKRMLPKTKLTYDESRLVRAYLVTNSK